MSKDLASPVTPAGTRPPPHRNAVNRRDFLWLTFGWFASVFALGAGGLAAVRALIPNVLFEPSRRFKAGKPEDYPDQAITFVEEVRLYILRKGNTFRALSAICPHLGCTVNLVSGKDPFLCPCHGSHFDNDGGVVGGPSPRGLSWLLVSLSHDGHLVIDMDHAVSHDKYLVV